VEVKREVYLVFVVLVQILACPLVHPCNGFADGIAGEYHSKSELEMVQDQRDALFHELECRAAQDFCAGKVSGSFLRSMNCEATVGQ
jgi:hypothetical protein